jgi:hypothetical protein
MAGVNMRLEAGAVRYVFYSMTGSVSVDSHFFRELHWHATAEWGYVIKV